MLHRPKCHPQGSTTKIEYSFNRGKVTFARPFDHATSNNLPSGCIVIDFGGCPKRIDNLVDLYEAWKKPEKAEEWRAKLPQTEAVDE